ncbi:unnamed protein product [Cuscuta campestris]|uniref:Uncharacterized protein n=1 Tax=Cuscuta campestris TaxID=132261 RepID=A0A484N1R5_9ASTE|nr:unnamed protein product [Cuscuta campestris]
MARVRTLVNKKKRERDKGSKKQKEEVKEAVAIRRKRGEKEGFPPHCAAAPFSVRIEGQTKSDRAQILVCCSSHTPLQIQRSDSHFDARKAVF